MKPLTKEQTKRFLAQPNGPEQLLDRGSAEFDDCYALFLEGYAPAGAYLCRAARRRELRTRLEAALGGSEPLYAALSSDSPKMRKHAARLIGLMLGEEAVGVVTEALRNEKTRFVRPSMILTLGALGGPEAEACLRAYRVPPAESEDERSHEEQERRALQTALKSFIKLSEHRFTGLTRPWSIELRTPEKLSDGLIRELSELGFETAGAGKDYVRVSTDALERLYEARCFYEPLLEIAGSASAHPKGIALKARGFMEEIAGHSHGGKPPIGYRIEIRGGSVDRTVLAQEIARHIDSELLINSPGNYELELRVELHQNGSAGLYIKLHSFKDHRFDYRRAAIPASIHPVTAAAILRYADAYLKPNARVIDPCCGSGTLLVERAKLCRCESLTGVDVNPRTIDIARGNLEAAGLPAQLIARDCLRFETALPYDELIANLPFGNRVGSHENNQRLYAGLLDRIPKWVRRGGVAVLYTMEYTMLKKLIRERPGLTLMGETRTQAGGLMPSVFIITVG